jgi:hypothetical protein
MRPYVRILAIAALVPVAACEQSPSTGSGFDNVPVLSATETSQDVGDFVIHFNALPTVDLSADVASQYGIVRSENQALLTVSIRRKLANQTDIGARADVTARATNLTGQLKEMTMREIAEENSVYYIGQVSITNAETLIFAIEVLPEGTTDSHSIRYMKQFFVGG